jgi:hypothetical protein
MPRAFLVANTTDQRLIVITYSALQNDRPVEKYYALPDIVCTLAEYVGE